MKQTTQVSTDAQMTHRGIERSRPGFHYRKTPVIKTDLITSAYKGEYDQNSATIRSEISNTNASESENSATSFPQHIVQRMVDIWRHLVLCYDVNIERRQLLKMSSEQLKDIGLDRSSVNWEARRNFLDIPPPRDGKLDISAYHAPQKRAESNNHIPGNKGFLALMLTGILTCIILLVLFGYVITLSVAAGFTGGSLVAWFSRGLRKYPHHHIDMRETD